MNDGEDILVKKADGTEEAYDENKLIASLRRSGASKEMSEEVAGHIGKELVNGITTNDIYRHAFLVLKNIRRPVAASYSLKRALAELGPSGYPFETFLAELFKSMGYSAVPRQTLNGNCVEHEVDVVAWKDDELVMVEAKFHNNHQLKTDLKVALYVKARFDDVKTELFSYGKREHFDKGFLITNTKFTSSAIKYAKCVGLELIGWNYPRKTGNLQDLIEKVGLHPITALSNFSEREKRVLLNRGDVLCKSISDNPDKLQDLNIEPKRKEELLKDIDELCGER